MAEFVGGEPISVGVDDPITFENKTDDSFSVDVGIVFRKSGLYRVSVAGKHTSVEIEPERKKGKWTKDCACEICGFKPWYERDIHTLSFCPNCGARMMEGEE